MNYEFSISVDTSGYADVPGAFFTGQIDNLRFQIGFLYRDRQVSSLVMYDYAYVNSLKNT